MIGEAYPCQHYDNCGCYCETEREQEHALCECCLGQHDEDMAEIAQAKPTPCTNDEWLSNCPQEVRDFAAKLSLTPKQSAPNAESSVPLSQRVRPNVEAAPWVIEQIKKLEASNAALLEALKAKA